uniref:Uncharacterized protein n=1 Tax=Timema poppense TaxID=170557 RepID=A0A7R9DE48_TIMPO|nr:unnamed protein product [Timema poppensis]
MHKISAHSSPLVREQKKTYAHFAHAPYGNSNEQAAICLVSHVSALTSPLPQPFRHDKQKKRQQEDKEHRVVLRQLVALQLPLCANNYYQPPVYRRLQELFPGRSCEDGLAADGGAEKAIRDYVAPATGLPPDRKREIPVQAESCCTSYQCEYPILGQSGPTKFHVMCVCMSHMCLLGDE